MYKKLYSKFLKGHEGFYHFASHSHHFWPDSSLKGQIEAWNDASVLSDKKWNKVMTEVIPRTQKHIAKILNFSRPQDIAFASNTHELFTRLLSSLDFNKGKIKVLTTKSEFHSFARQIKRLNELDLFEIESLDNEKENFTEVLSQKLKTQKYDLVYLSHVFFNSGLRLELDKLTEDIKNFSGVFVLDGYHAFCAIPVDIRPLENNIFYLAGGYKYAQGGEGVCFMTLPKDCKLRPLNTGWFAHFNSLETTSTGLIDYATDGMRFWGSTIDVSAFYRFNAVWDEFSSLNIDVSLIHAHVEGLQRRLIKGISPFFLEENLEKIGHFLTADFESEEVCRKSYQELELANILCDFRGNRLRFGFGLYQNEQEVDQLIQSISEAKLLNFIKK